MEEEVGDFNRLFNKYEKVLEENKELKLRIIKQNQILKKYKNYITQILRENSELKLFFARIRGGEPLKKIHSDFQKRNNNSFTSKTR